MNECLLSCIEWPSDIHESTPPLGSDDVLLPTENSILMWQKLQHANAQLHLYPDSGHGFLYQYAAHFAATVNAFLDQDHDVRSEPATRHSRL
jgi:pimeloyl-ACP methyl ester carboxylesterase